MCESRHPSNSHWILIQPFFLEFESICFRSNSGFESSCSYKALEAAKRVCRIVIGIENLISGFERNPLFSLESESGFWLSSFESKFSPGSFESRFEPTDQNGFFLYQKTMKTVGCYFMIEKWLNIYRNPCITCLCGLLPRGGGTPHVRTAFFMPPGTWP